MKEAIRAGAMKASAEMGVDFENPPPKALDYAERRAGELIGTGSDRRFDITETIRERVRGTVETAIEEGWSTRDLASAMSDIFSTTRANTIARTETAIAYNKGAAEQYAEHEVETLLIIDGIGCLPEGHDDTAPDPETDEIGVQTDAQANGQMWTPQDYGSFAIGHPNCVRAAAPLLPEDYPRRSQSTDEETEE